MVKDSLSKKKVKKARNSNKRKVRKKADVTAKRTVSFKTKSGKIIQFSTKE